MDSNAALVDHLFRTEYGKVLAILCKFLGFSHLQLAEDIVQDALISAMTDWAINGVPEHPTAWLVQVAKRKAINELKRNKLKESHQHTIASSLDAFTELDDVYLNNEIEDSQLRMIFACCHSSLSIESQITLTLKTLCGFGVREIAAALLSTESTIHKRLFRAKEAIRKSNKPFQPPSTVETTERIDTVSLTLYLLFNQGYNSTSGNLLIQKELCLEAMRLVKLLVAHYENDFKLKALIALMCFHAARFEARLDHKGTLIVFEDQDRSRWNQDLIHIGMHYFKNSLNAKEISSHHVEARIAAAHCLAKSFEETDWELIYEQYELLSRLKPTPIIQLNLAIIESKISGYNNSLAKLMALQKDKSLKDYYLLNASIGIFLIKNGDFKEAIIYLEKTIALNPSKTEINYLKQQIAICQSNLGVKN